MKERKGICDADEIELQIFKIYDMLKTLFNELIEKTNLHIPSVLVESIVSEKDQIKYGMMQDPEKKTKPNLALINQFQEIGQIDPFPFDYKLPKGVDPKE